MEVDHADTVAVAVGRVCVSRLSATGVPDHCGGEEEASIRVVAIIQNSIAFRPGPFRALGDDGRGIVADDPPHANPPQIARGLRVVDGPDVHKDANPA
jgi:hypothetical protein